MILSLIVSDANPIDIKRSPTGHHRGVVGDGAGYEYVCASIVGKGALIAESDGIEAAQKGLARRCRWGEDHRH